MGEHRRKADGRRVFSTEFKRTAVQRILTGEKTLAELSRELDISPSVIRNWKRYAEAGATTAVQASEDVVPASHSREAYAKIRDLERALRRKTMAVELLRAAQQIAQKTPPLRRGSGLAEVAGNSALGDRLNLPPPLREGNGMETEVRPIGSPSGIESPTEEPMIREDVVREMLARLARGEGIKRIARELGVDR